MYHQYDRGERAPSATPSHSPDPATYSVASPKTPKFASPRGQTPKRCSAPRLAVVLLLGRRLVDLHPERGELEPSDLAIDRTRNRVHAGTQICTPLDKLLHAKRLQRERDIHHGRRM